jgi:hypothetical protein
MPRTLAALGLVALLASPIPVLAGQRRNPTRCSDYATREQARQALQRGETWLDHDRDGIPCETHFSTPRPSASPRPTRSPRPSPTPTRTPRR